MNNNRGHVMKMWLLLGSKPLNLTIDIKWMPITGCDSDTCTNSQQNQSLMFELQNWVIS